MDPRRQIGWAWLALGGVTMMAPAARCAAAGAWPGPTLAAGYTPAASSARAAPAAGGAAAGESEEEPSILFAPDDPDDQTPQGSESGAAAPARDKTAPPPGALTEDGPLGKIARGHQPREAKVFGRYRVRIGVSRPEFKDLFLYQQLYGKESFYPTLGADWYAWDWYATFGLSFRMGYYTDEGHPVRGGKTPKGEINANNYELDEASKSTLTLVPFQAALTAQLTPFKQKWIVLDGWVGLERLYYQEVRTGAQATAATTTAPAGSGTAPDTTLTNKGWKGGNTVGFSCNFLLNFLDEQSARSMRGALGLQGIYLSPYIEMVHQNDGGVDFSRTNKGIAFTFESVY